MDNAPSRGTRDIRLHEVAPSRVSSRSPCGRGERSRRLVSCGCFHRDHQSIGPLPTCERSERLIGQFTVMFLIVHCIPPGRLSQHAVRLFRPTERLVRPFRADERRIAGLRTRKTMATAAQIAANRRNALKSTGPRTAAGKAVSSRNALRHGLRARATVVLDEDPRDFEAFGAELRAALAPRDGREELLAETVVHAAWRMSARVRRRRLRSSTASGAWTAVLRASRAADGHPPRGIGQPGLSSRARAPGARPVGSGGRQAASPGRRPRRAARE